MLILRKIVLQLGAIFLLVTLKTHGGLARSVTNSGQQVQRPELRNSRSHEEMLKHSNNTESILPPVLSANIADVENPLELTTMKIVPERGSTTPDQKTDNYTELWNSTNFNAQLVANEFAVDVNGLNYNETLHIKQMRNTNGANESTSTDSVFDGLEGNYTSHEAVSKERTLPSSEDDGNELRERLLNLEDMLRDFRNRTYNISDNDTSSETRRESLVAAGRRAIKNLGADLKKLKKNVDSFKQNLRKMLFESELPNVQLDDSSASSKNESGIILRKNDNTSYPFQRTDDDPRNMTQRISDAFQTKRNNYISQDGIPHFTKISAAASNMSEASRRMGAFIQKQYVDSKEKYQQNAHDAMVSRGLENLVKGVEESEMPSSQVLQQWVNLEESFRESVDAVVRQALPLLVRASSEMQLSNGCYTSFFQLLLGLRRLRPWAFQMIDAFGKPPAGMLQGTITSFGAYDECVNIVAMSDAKKKNHVQQYFRGKYCTVEIKPPLPPKPQYYTMYQPVSILANFSNSDDNVIRQAAKQAHAFYFLTYRMDICVPSTCTQDDVNNMAQFAAKYIDIEVAVPRCSVKEDLHLDRSQVTIICIVAVLLAFVTFGTTLDTVRELFYKTKAVSRCMGRATRLERPYSILQTPIISLKGFRNIICNVYPRIFDALSKLLLSFSLNTNADLLLNTDSAQNGLDIVHGMRFFGMGWLVLGHTYFNSNVQMYGNLSEASAFAEGFLFQIIVNSTVSIDTFFFISAVLLSYLTLQSKSMHGYYSIPRLFLRRLMRVLPPYMMVIGATLLLPHLGSGPFWNETVDPVVEACKQNWWTNILFINNFVTTPTQRCLEHSWYLSCDFQLFIVALFILLALIKRPALGIALNVFMIMVSMFMTGFLTYHYKVPPTLLASFPDPEERKFLNHVIISKPYCHLGPYCIGLATGYFFFKCKEIKLKAYHHILGWGSAVSVTAAVVYGVLEWNKGNLPSTPAALAYAATHRTAWALGLSWITVICVSGYGGIINRILSWKVFIPLSRLTCMVYLIHPLIQYILTGYIRERLQTNHIILAYFFFGHIMTSYALSAACFFIFDGPVEALMRLVMGDCTAPAPELAKTFEKKTANNNLKHEKQRNIFLASK